MSARPSSRWRRLTLRDVLFLTVPPFALAMWLFGSAVLDYHRVRQFEDWWADATSVRKYGWYRIRAALRAPRMTALDSRMSAEREDVSQLRLIVDRNDWDRIDGDVGAHWGEWIDVQVLDQGDWHDAELRFRGDGSAHWSTEKKSFTLKSKRGDLYKGFRTMAFSVKDVLPQYLAATLASDFDLIAPEQQVVPVFLNDRFYGLHRFIEPIDESLLRRNLRMPGNVFRADTAERGDYFKGLPREVFRNPYIWDRAANNDRPGAFGTSLLAQYLRDLNGTTFEEHERFLEWLDRDEISRLLAYLLVVGDPYHMSGVHNQFWYEDPVNGSLHPIPWDVRLLELGKPPQGSNVNRFWRAALKDPRIWAGTMRVLSEKLADDSLVRGAEERMERVERLYADAIEYEQLRGGVIPPIGDAREALATLRKNVETLRGWMADARVRCLATRSAEPGEWVIDVVVEGRAPCTLVNLGFDLSQDADAFGNELHADSNGNGVRDPEDRELFFRSEFDYIGPDLELPSSVGGTGHELSPAPAHYRLFYRDAVIRGSLDAITPSFVNALTGVEVRAEPLEPGATLPATGTWRPWRYEHAAPPPIVLSGDVAVDSDLLVAEGGSLTIEPGTTLTLSPNVSIESRGPVIARGTEERPITIRRADPALPWGVFALQGPGANGSRFAHVRFLGGGGRQVGRVEYKGSVCVHYAKEVEFSECEFADNSRCDDLINVVKGDADVIGCRFHDANADSIDYDMSSGLVAFNTIERSGNDGLDLMTCWPRVIGGTITGSGDKGLSVGEDSEPFVFSVRIDGCVRGIEAKDRSEPIVARTGITNCDLGIYSHVKNWRYGAPGWPKLVQSVVAGNRTDYEAKDGARITLEGCSPGERPGDALDGGAIEWLLREHGVVSRPDGSGFGLVEPLAPLHEVRFQEDFVDPRAGWSGDRGTERLVVRGPDLVAHFAGAGRVGKVFDWDLSDPTKRYVVVLELSGEEVDDARAAITSGDGRVEAALALGAEPTTYRYTAIEVPPGRYDGLMLSARAAGPRARLRLHSIRVHGLPREPEGR
jgi:hypothetical protein